jgi:hypothetical protein
MAMYAQGTKRQKTRDARTFDANEFFPGKLFTKII